MPDPPDIMIALPAEAPPRLDRSSLPSRWTQGRDLLRELVARDIALRYRGSLLGVVWTLLNPLAELLVLIFVLCRLPGRHPELPCLSLHRVDRLRLVSDLVELWRRWRSSAIANSSAALVYRR